MNTLNMNISKGQQEGSPAGRNVSTSDTGNQDRREHYFVFSTSDAVLVPVPGQCLPPRQ